MSLTNKKNVTCFLFLI